MPGMHENHMHCAFGPRLTAQVTPHAVPTACIAASCLAAICGRRVPSPIGSAGHIKDTFSARPFLGTSIAATIVLVSYQHERSVGVIDVQASP